MKMSEESIEGEETNDRVAELLKKIEKLEKGHALLKQKILSHHLLQTTSSSHLHPPSPRRQLSESQCENILESSLGQSVHMFDFQHRIIYWNKMAEKLYGYSAGEAIGKKAPEIIIGPKYSELATIIIQRALKGEKWFGEFPMRNRKWERFSVITTLSPYRDHHGAITAAICICADARPFLSSNKSKTTTTPTSSSHHHHSPLNSDIQLLSSNLLASKVKSKMNDDTDHDGRSTGDSCYSDFAPSDCSRHDDFSTGEHFRGGGSENRRGIYEVLSSKAETWMMMMMGSKKGLISWPWKERNENEEKIRWRGGWLPWLDNDYEEHESGSQPISSSSSSSFKVETQLYESTSASNTNGMAASWPFSCGASSSGRTTSINKFDIRIGNLDDVEISWEDLIVRKQIGQVVEFVSGSYGTVYHALWYGSDVAVKVFTNQEYTDDVILSFKKEVSLMKRLRHPNILLFMGSVTSPEHLCIVTEFLSRGSLFGLLQRNKAKLDWRHRISMAMDIARGMNYLHQCHPPIIHCDLKSSNLLVDKNWMVKVGDFGLSRIKRESYLTTKIGTGTPQWMAPEILRNEQADEKSDVYSYGVILWEITTEKIPWDNLNSMQVIGAVGFMNQRLEIPKDVNPLWASIIESCWSSEPQSRPTFQEILTKLKDLQKKFAVPHRNTNSL